MSDDILNPKSVNSVGGDSANEGTRGKSKMVKRDCKQSIEGSMNFVPMPKSIFNATFVLFVSFSLTQH